MVIRVSRKNKWRLLTIGLISLLTPTLLTTFVPMGSEEDALFLNGLRLFCYALPGLLLVVYFLQSKQKITIDASSRAITDKGRTINPEDVIDFEIEHMQRRQFQAYSIYLRARTNQRILIGATTSSHDTAAMERYAKAMLDYIRTVPA
ncbi:MAG: hypothetical protein ACK5LS_05170 [Propioniciclava sp.]